VLSGSEGLPFFLEVGKGLEVFVLVFVGHHAEFAFGVGEAVAEAVAACASLGKYDPLD